MRRLVKTTGETVTLAVPGDRATLETIAQVDSPQIIRDHHWVGAVLPLHATSNGKLLLARWPDEALRDLALPRLTPRTITTLDALREELARVRSDGHAVCLDEAETGLTGLAVALTDRAGALVATLTVSGPTFRFGRAARSAHLASLRAAARRGGRAPRPVAGPSRTPPAGQSPPVDVRLRATSPVREANRSTSEPALSRRCPARELAWD
jgi:DNA-binding IclR family transcriptional regulator